MKEKTNLLFLAYIGLLGTTAIVSMLWLTPYGSGVSPDSTVYIGGANSLLFGGGFSNNGSPIVRFPPLYPIFLATTSLFEKDLVQAARFLSAILFGVNVGLVASAVYFTTGRSFLATTFSAFFFLSSAPFIEIHSMAWSEPLFIFLSLASIILLSLYAKRPTAPFFIASAVSLGLAIITRYIGVAFLPAAMVILFVGAADQPLYRRLRNVLIWLLLSCAPLGIFFARNMVVAGMTSNRALVLHLVPVPQYVSQLVANVLDFVAPISLQVDARPMILGLLAAYLIIQYLALLKRHPGAYQGDNSHRSVGAVMPLSSLMFTVSYLLFLFISISFFDAATPVDDRLLSPIHVIMIVGLFPLIWTISQSLKKPRIWWSFLLLTGLSIFVKTPEAIRSATAIQEQGSMYTSRQWRDSESVAFVKSLPQHSRIYSNGADALGFLTKKESLAIPAKVSAMTMHTNPLYSLEIAAMCKDIRENDALLVYINLITWRPYLATQKEVELDCQLPLIRHFADGIVYAERYP